MMKYLISCCLLLAATWSSAQVSNTVNPNNYNAYSGNNPVNNQLGIVAGAYNLTINTKVLYNATPDGYHATYTKSFISTTIEEVELLMNKKTASLINTVKALNIAPEEVLVDIIALDPIFDLNLRDTAANSPIGYKITENITFRINKLSTLRKLSKICLDYDIYDLISVQAFLNNSIPILDSLAAKSVKILNMKKKLSEDIGWKLEGGKVTFKKNKQVVYPNERYLRSLAKNNSIYSHHISQNYQINYNRQLTVDNQYQLNYKYADFVFNDASNEPIIQFFYELVYTYNKVNTEAITAKKEAKEADKKRKKLYYLDDGELKELDMD